MLLCLLCTIGTVEAGFRRSGLHLWSSAYRRPGPIKCKLIRKQTLGMLQGTLKNTGSIQWRIHAANGLSEQEQAKYDKPFSQQESGR